MLVFVTFLRVREQVLILLNYLGNLEEALPSLTLGHLNDFVDRGELVQAGDLDASLDHRITGHSQQDVIQVLLDRFDTDFHLVEYEV